MSASVPLNHALSIDTDSAITILFLNICIAASDSMPLNSPPLLPQYQQSQLAVECCLTLHVLHLLYRLYQCCIYIVGAAAFAAVELSCHTSSQMVEGIAIVIC